MRCKVGDLAVRIKKFDDDEIPVGAIVRCVEYYVGPVSKRGNFAHFAGWLVEYKGSLTHADGAAWAALDEHLQPIRNPGEYARDESLSWLPVPSREEVSA